MARGFKADKEVPPAKEVPTLTREDVIAMANIPCPTCGGQKCPECLHTGKVIDRNEPLEVSIKKRLCK